ncbi:hypothetical protein GGS26DRAFT_576463 [Hypomontagnella submonticulosa]|nr:hypothetical protein GGS26DRAFT_576463 [Hypomontagnella submonticulosa]
MPPPLPVPSKAAIHALRGIALGTSCAIGVILEDRRRRISTLRAAVSNKEKLRSSKQYHGMAESLTLQLDDAVFVEADDIHWDQLDNRARALDDFPVTKLPRRRKSADDSSTSTEPTTSSHATIVPESSSSPPPPQRSVSPLNIIPMPSTLPQTRVDMSDIRSFKPRNATNSIAHRPRPENRDGLVNAITSVLASKDKQRLDRALEMFFEGSRSLFSSKSFDDEWIAVSAQISETCERNHRYEDAARVLSSTLDAGPLSESQYYAHRPMPIIDWHLSQKDENGRCSREVVALATRLYLPKLTHKPRKSPGKLPMYFTGQELFTQNLMLNNISKVHDIYWRTIPLLEDPVVFGGWAIRELYEYSDYKNVVKYFLLNYSKMVPKNTNYEKTIDCVVYAVERLKGLKADQILRALAKMNRPENGLLPSRWIMRLLQATWCREHSFPLVKELFEETLSLGLLDLVGYFQGPYVTMIEISIKAGEDDMARSYYEALIHKDPEMVSSVRLRGFVALRLAKAGDWDGVYDAFTDMQVLRDGYEDDYDDAFITILKVFADTHPAAEVRDFVSKYTSTLGVRMHPYIVTAVANKYGDCRDMSGFISWLTYCSKAGFALDSSFCNSVLHNCRTRWKLPYFELRAIHSKMQQLGADLSDDATRRMMSQAALGAKNPAKELAPNRRVNSRIIAVNKLAYAGRSTNKRDIYEAMNQEIHKGKMISAISIYKRALEYGMPSCPHCLRLAVLAALRNSRNGHATALTLLHTAHQKGEDISPALSAFMRFQLDNIQGNAEEVLLHMRNLITRFEALHVIIDPAVLTHMALIFMEIGQFERVIALCTLAMDKGGYKNLCFSRRSARALLMAYARTLDLDGMRKLLDDLPTSDLSADKSVLSYLKSTRRTVEKMQKSTRATAILDMLKDATKGVLQRRAVSRTEGEKIVDETLRIMQDALDNMKNENISIEAALQRYVEHEDPPQDNNGSPPSLVAAA